jgi:site-specific DNA-methyltransferase (adenine-specific)
MDYMKTLPDNAFDLAIVDPPYGIDVTKMNMGGRKTITPDKTKSWDNAIPNQDYFDELFRVSKNQIIWGGNYFPLKPTRCWIMWDKGESMYGRDFAEAEMAWTNFDKVVRLYKQNPNQLDRIHPTQKPVKLYEWLLTNYAKQGDKILDTHLGSGSHAIACNNLGFEMVGCELDTDYFDAACKRIKQETAQERLFE